MRILWVCNIILPAIAEKLNIEYSSREGWLSGAAEKVLDPEQNNDIELGICFPYGGEIPDTDIELDNGAVCRCFAFSEDLRNPQKYDASLERRFKEITDEFKPDLIHIFGTEFPHALACARAWNRPERLLVGIQGLCSACAEKYMADLPLKVQHSVTLRDILRMDTLRQQQKKFCKRSKHEDELLKLTANITGRTTWDRVETGKINPAAEYYAMNETLRSCFYQDSWNSEACVRHTVFMSQGDYPIKGMHYMLEAMPTILQAFPDAMLYVSGIDVTRHGTLKEKLKISAYGSYLVSLIRKYRLEEHVVMPGTLDAEQMKQQYLISNVYACTSAIENSPNSLGEAMLLGVPCVAAEVGGIPDLMVGGQDGILYPAGDTGKLAEAIIEIFSKDDVSKLYSISAKKHAYRTHDPEVNYRRLLEIYESIAGKSDVPELNAEEERTVSEDSADAIR